MKKLIVILLLFWGKNILAQATSTKEDSIADYESDKETIAGKKNCFQMSYFSDFNYRPVYTDHGILNGDQKTAGRIAMESSSISCGWIRQIKKHVALDVDVEVSGKNVRTGTIYFKPNGSNAVQETEATYISNSTYLNIPIGVDYSVGKKFRVGLYSGFAFKFKMSDALHYYKTYSDSSGRGDDIVLTGKHDGFNLEYRAAVFAEYNLKRVKYRVIPIYRIDMLNTFRGINWKNANSTGLGVQLIL